MAYQHCIARLRAAAGRPLTDAEVAKVFERIHKAALDIKAGRARTTPKSGLGQGVDNLITVAAREAAEELIHEAAMRAKQTHQQLVVLSARIHEVDAMTAKGVPHLDAVERVLARDYSGRVNVESLEQRATGWRDYLKSKVLGTWAAMGRDWMGFFQDRQKLVTLVRELRGESSGDAAAARGAKAFHDAAEEARQAFNRAGGDVGKLDDWGMPQHHSQELVARAGKDAWIDATMPLLDRTRYVDDLGQRWSDTELRKFLEKAWWSIATNGHANTTPGQHSGTGKRANRHAEHRQIHFKDADSVISYWERFGEQTPLQILDGHLSVMARDIAFLEHLGPNPDLTYQTLRDLALQKGTQAEPTKTPNLEGRVKRLDILFDYAAGRTTPSANITFSKVMDGIANINVAAKLGGAALASLFGDKAMMEAVRHLNHLPAWKTWMAELSLLNPANAADRRLLQRQGLMLDSVRSGMTRFYEGLGDTGWTSKIANGVMRITGMTAINDIRKGAFGVALMDAIGSEIRKGVDFANLAATDRRLLKNYGITKTDWEVWKLAQLERIGPSDAVLTPEAISRITDADLQRTGILGAASTAEDGVKVRRDAVVKLLGAINTESEFAIVTPGWKERAAFYGDLQRGTVKGEIARSWLQFKSFPFTQFFRMLDATGNKDGYLSKAAMSAYLVTSTTVLGAMLVQTREMLAGRDPLDSTEPRFWGKALLSGGALGIYGDFVYNITTRRDGAGILETMAGPTMGPLLEMGVMIPGQAMLAQRQGKESHFWAREAQAAKGFMPAGNIWYGKAAFDHLITHNVLEWMSPGYLASLRSRAMKDFQQDWWWAPGQATPDRAPDLTRALGR